MKAASGARGREASAVHRIAPELPPLPAGHVQRLHRHAKQVPVRIPDDTVVAAWTFEGDTPERFVHTPVGTPAMEEMGSENFAPSMEFALVRSLGSDGRRLADQRMSRSP